MRNSVTLVRTLKVLFMAIDLLKSFSKNRQLSFYEDNDDDAGSVLGQCVHGNEAGTDSEAQYVTWAAWAGRCQECEWGVELGKVEATSYDVSFFMYIGNVTCVLSLCAAL